MDQSHGKKKIQIKEKERHFCVNINGCFLGVRIKSEKGERMAWEVFGEWAWEKLMRTFLLTNPLPFYLDLSCTWGCGMHETKKKQNSTKDVNKIYIFI